MAEDPGTIRNCYDKLRKAVGNIPMDPSGKLENLSSGKISEILPMLFLSGRTVSQNSDLLKEKNIKTVINVSDREIVNYKSKYPFVKNYRFYSMSDTANAKFDGIVEEAIRLIHETRKSGESVLIHCFLGVSRSATLVAFYLISSLGMNWREAVDYIRMKRCSANPNFGFLHQLKLFSNGRSESIRLELTNDGCRRMRESDRDVIKKYLPLAVIQL
uniref:Dual specificity protein phosphatase n=1 Tax=Caenorhabditis tropicalis TaxID=1561998 RepID=A0A1I7U951_9PELO